MHDEMPVIDDCEMSACAYNQQRVCHARAITVGDGACPMCDTFFSGPDKGGVAMKGAVGACRESDCEFNVALECVADGIRVADHAGHPDCQTYRPR